MYSKITIAGNLGADPEMKYMQSGDAVTNFSVATNRKWNNKASGELVEEVAWFRVSVFGRQAEACNEYLSKGRQVLVEGRIKPDPKTGGPRLWTAQDGTVRSSFEVTADKVVFLGGGEASSADSPSASKPAADAEEDEIPF
jgi:single-strand DNA-binding protein